MRVLLDEDARDARAGAGGGGADVERRTTQGGTSHRMKGRRSGRRSVTTHASRRRNAARLGLSSQPSDAPFRRRPPKLESLPAAAGRVPLQGQEGRGALRRQGQEPARARAQLLPGGRQRRALLHPAPAAHASATSRPSSPAPRRKRRSSRTASSSSTSRATTSSCATTRSSSRCASRLEHRWPRLEVVRRPDRRRRALLRPVPLGDGGAPHAAPRQQALPAPHVQRSRARVAQAAVPAVPDQALPGAVRLRRRPRLVRRAGARRGAVPRRPPRRALARAGATRCTRRRATCASSSPPCTAISSAPIERVREEQRVVTEDIADQDVLGLYREGDLVELALLHVRNGPPRRRVHLLAHATRRSPTRSSSAASSPSTTATSDDEAGASRSDSRRRSWSRCSPKARTASRSGCRERAGRKVTVLIPKRGARAQLLELATNNAQHAFVEKARTTDDMRGAPRAAAGAPAPAHAAAAHRVLRHLAPRRRRHRRRGRRAARRRARQEALPHLPRARRRRARHAGRQVNDDYAAMYEVLARRFRRGAAAQDQTLAENAHAPRRKADGERRLGAARISSSSTAAAASSPSRSRRRTISACTICPSSRSPRSASSRPRRRTARRKRRSSSIASTCPARRTPSRSRATAPRCSSSRAPATRRTASPTARASGSARRAASSRRSTTCPESGPRLKKALLTTLGSVAAIRSATDEELLAVPGIRKKHVEALRKALPANAE